LPRLKFQACIQRRLALDRNVTIGNKLLKSGAADVSKALTEKFIKADRFTGGGFKNGGYMTDTKIPMTKGQKRLLWLVYIMGGILAVMFVFTLGMIIWKLAT
jgi:hypothetical protein